MSDRDSVGGVIKAVPGVEKNTKAGRRRAWRIAQDMAVEREKAGDTRGSFVADQICERIEKELGI